MLFFFLVDQFTTISFSSALTHKALGGAEPACFTSKWRAILYNQNVSRHNTQCMGQLVDGFRVDLNAIALYHAFVGSNGQFVAMIDTSLPYVLQQFRGAIMATTITTHIASTLSKEDVPTNVCSHGVGFI